MSISREDEKRQPAGEMKIDDYPSGDQRLRDNISNSNQKGIRDTDFLKLRDTQYIGANNNHCTSSINANIKNKYYP
jgi:hypothetical protein